MALRKLTDDLRLRPFLSSHFDRQIYIKNLINDGNSEECLADITECIEIANIEIKTYISKNTDNLMNGMSDFNRLNERYDNLATTSQKLQQSILSFKKEASDSYNVVKLRTFELERIHDASIKLRLLRQFIHAKLQLDHQQKSNDLTDLKSLGTLDAGFLVNFAKIVFELESLVNSKCLDGINYVSENSIVILLFSKELRFNCREKLITAVEEKNQTNISNCLQIFFNLQTLPEAMLMVMDNKLKAAVEATLRILDLESLSRNNSDLLKTNPLNPIGIGGLIFKKPSVDSFSMNTMTTSTAKISNTKQNQTQHHAIQFELLLKTISQSWSSSICENVLQIYSLQKVLHKKVDTATHRRFTDILSTFDTSTVLQNDELGKIWLSNLNHKDYFKKCDLVPLFLEKLSSSIHDAIAEKARHYPVAAVLLFPYLHKSGIEAFSSFQKIVSRYYGRDPFEALRLNSVSTNSSDFRVSNLNLFGSLSYSYDDLFISLGIGSNSGTSRSKDLLTVEMSTSRAEKGNEVTLITGLKPFKDKYLSNVNFTTSEPIHMMFPQMEGYTAAIPSKRDLQSFTKVIQNELDNAIVDGEYSLVGAVAKECLKSIELLLTKVEGIIYSGPEPNKIVYEKGNFARNQHQDHNAQLVGLLVNLNDCVSKISIQTSKTARDTPGAGVFVESINISPHNAVNTDQNTIDSQNKKSVHAVLDEMKVHAVEKIDALMKNNLLLPVVDLLTKYIRTHLQLLLKEGTPTSTLISSNSASSTTHLQLSTDTSKTMSVLAKQLPDLIRVYLGNLPQHYCVSSAMTEVILRIKLVFVSISAMVRPMNETTKLRIAADMTMIEETVQLIEGVRPQVKNCPINLEFKSFQRLLFSLDNSGSVNEKINFNDTNVPTKEKIMNLNYVQLLRPSTLLSFLFSCAPTLLPLPYQEDIDFIEEFLNFEDSDLKIATNDKSNYYYSDDFPASYVNIFTKVSDHSSWNNMRCEKKCWQAHQDCLDKLVQRLGVLEDKNVKENCRKWYEVLLEVGYIYFGNSR